MCRRVLLRSILLFLSALALEAQEAGGPSLSLDWRFVAGGAPRGGVYPAPGPTYLFLAEDRAAYRLDSEGRFIGRVGIPGRPEPKLRLAADGRFAFASQGELRIWTAGGNRLWELSLSEEALLWELAENGLLWTAEGDTLVVRNPRGGVLWRYNADGRITHLRLVPGGALVASSAGSVFGLTDGGAVVFRHFAGGTLRSLSMVDSGVCLSTEGRVLELLSPEGRLVQRMEGVGPFESCARLGADFVGLRANGDLALVDGNRVTEMDLSGRSVSSLLAAGPEALLFGTRTGRLYLLGPAALVQDSFSGFDGGTVTHISRGVEGRILATSSSWVIAQLEVKGADKPAGSASSAWGLQTDESLLEGLYLQSRAREAGEAGKREVFSEVDRAVGSANLQARLVTHTEALGYILTDAPDRDEADYPQLRAAAAQLLGRIGTLQARSILLSALPRERVALVAEALIRALGRVGSDADGRVAATLRRQAARFREDREAIAVALIDAYEDLWDYRGGIETEGLRALQDVALGPYPRELRARALEAIRTAPRRNF